MLLFQKVCLSEKHSLKISLVWLFSKSKTVKFKDHITVKGTTFFCNGQTFKAGKWLTGFPVTATTTYTPRTWHCFSIYLAQGRARYRLRL
jgi:hypothetical protein